MPTYKNLFTNPSFETASGTVTVRTNLCTNPRMLTLTGWANASPGLITQTATASGQQYDVTASGIGNLSGITYESTALTVAPGDIVGTSMQVTVPSGFPAVSVLLDAQEYTSGSTGANARGSAVTVQPGQTVTVYSGILTVDSSGNGFRSVLRYAATTPVGARIVVANCLVEKATPSIGAYFDGAQAASGDFTYAWTGPADASTCTQTASSVANSMANGATQGYGVRSSDWSAGRSKSLRVMHGPTGTGFAYIGSSASTIPVVAGGFYTLVATGRMIAAQTGSGVADARSRSLGARFPQGLELLQGPQLPNAAGVNELRWSFQVPAGRTTMYGVFWQGVNVVGDVWWDDAMLVQIPDLDHPYVGGYFDGSSTSSFGYAASWDGAADASTSTLQTIEIAVTPYLDANPSPRAEVFVEDPPDGTVTLTRFESARQFLVPGGVQHPAGSGVSVIDTEIAFGVPVTYQAECFDPDGTSLGFITSPAVTLPVTDTWVSQPLDPRRAVKVDLTDASAADLTRGFDGSTVYTDGASVGVWIGGRRRGLEGVVLEFETSTQADMDTLQSVLGGYDGDDQVAVLCVRTPPAFSRLPRTLFLSAPKPTESDINVRYGGTLTVLRVTGDEVRRPAPALTAALLTYADIDLFFGTYSAIDANYGSYLARDRDYEKAGYAE